MKIRDRADQDHTSKTNWRWQVHLGRSVNGCTHGLLLIGKLEGDHVYPYVAQPREYHLEYVGKVRIMNGERLVCQVGTRACFVF